MTFTRKILLLCFGGIFALTTLPAVAQNIRAPANGGRVICLETSNQENSAAAAATSQLRRSEGLGKIRPSERLAEAAAKHACDMARRNEMTHQGSKLRKPSQRVRAEGYRTRMVAENIGKGFSRVEHVLEAWNRSQGHRDNIMLPEVRDFGIGKAVAADGMTVYWAAVYATSR